MNALTQRQGWLAQLELGYQLRGDKTRLVHSKREGPLSVQRAFYPEGDVCHTYLLHPPGGVVAGDQLHIDLRVEADAKVLLTTPGATKFYRSTGAQADLAQKLYVAAGGALDVLSEKARSFFVLRIQTTSSHTRTGKTNLPRPKQTWPATRTCRIFAWDSSPPASGTRTCPHPRRTPARTRSASRRE